MIWELFFMLVVLKIPVVYLCAVVWWAIRAVPDPLEGVVVAAGVHAPPGCDWRGRARRRPEARRPRLPRGGSGRFAGPARVAQAHALRRAAREDVS